MKKTLTSLLAFLLTLTALTGCAGKSAGNGRTPAELTELYADAITEHGGEMVTYNPVISQAGEDEMAAMMLEMLGLKEEDMQAFGISMSLMNVKAYGIVAAMPAEGKTDVVKDALQNFIDNQQQSFETYLADQYEVAKNAKLETLKDGTVLMVMCEDSDTVVENIKRAIEG